MKLRNLVDAKNAPQLNKKTKITATLGPASFDCEVIEQLVLAGADMFRLNLSHGSHAQHEHFIRTIRDLEVQYQRPIPILADLQGPKLRTGNFENEQVTLHQGQEFILDSNMQLGDLGRVYLPHPEAFEHVKAGGIIMIDDGKVVLQVRVCDKDRMVTKVMVPGTISNAKGVHFAGSGSWVECLTEKDRLDLVFFQHNPVDIIGLSFVKCAADLDLLRGYIAEHVLVLAKIETTQAMQNIDAIVQKSDMVMVARGDLALDIGYENVPAARMQIVKKCHEYAKPVIVATEMLASMCVNLLPTRAEAADVFLSAKENADSVMLSGETSTGMYPVQCVKVMQKILSTPASTPSTTPPSDLRNDAECIANACRSMGVKAVLLWYQDYQLICQLSAQHLDAAVYVFANEMDQLRSLNLLWGVQSMILHKPKEDYEFEGPHLLQSQNMLSLGDIVMIIGAKKDTDCQVGMNMLLNINIMRIS